MAVPECAHLDITFYPPDRRKRDLDNMLGAIKYGLDGIAKASGVDDYGWSLTISRGVPVDGGEVHIQFKTDAAGRGNENGAAPQRDPIKGS